MRPTGDDGGPDAAGTGRAPDPYRRPPAPRGVAYRIRSLGQRLARPVGGVAAHRGPLVGVAVKGKLDAGVPREVLGVLRMYATTEQDREAAVPLLTPL